MNRSKIMNIIGNGNTRFGNEQNLAHDVTTKVPREVQLQWLIETFPNGKQRGNVFYLGSLQGDAGESLRIDINLSSHTFMQGTDFNGGEGVGGISKILMAGRGWRFKDVMDLAKEYIDSPTTRPSPPQNPIRPPWLHPPAAPAFAQPEQVQAPPVKQRVSYDINSPFDAEHDYTDADGVVLVTVRRYNVKDETGEIVRGSDGKAKKEFRQFVGGFPYPKIPDVRPLYNIPNILASDRIIWVEGEKCADDLNRLGYTAFCTMGGSGMLTPNSAGSFDFSPLQGKEIILWPDNDAAGKKLAKLVQDLSIRAGARSVTMLTPPMGKPDKWDASDAISEGFDVAKFVKVSEKKLKHVINILDDSLTIGNQFRGTAPEQVFLLDDTIPLGVPVVFAAAGDSGKGMMTLDLAMKIVSGKPLQYAFGSLVSAFGNVVLLCAEDDKDELHRRIERLDPYNQRYNYPNKLYIIPLPNLGGVFPMMQKIDNSYVMGEEFGRLYEQILQIDNLVLFSADPMASFVHADVNADPAAGAAFMGLLAQIATETGATVMVNHHMGKLKEADVIKTPEQARNMIRGTSAIVDGVRCAFAVWQIDEETARDRCRFLNIPYSRNICFDGAVVKSNGPANRDIRHFVRDMNSGLLIDRGIELMNAQSNPENRTLRKDAVLGLIAMREGNGEAMNATGNNGVYRTAISLPRDHIFVGAITSCSESTINKVVADLLQDGDVIKQSLTATRGNLLLGVRNGMLDQGVYVARTGRDNSP